MELSNNLTEIHALVYALLARIDVLEARVSELDAENKALESENAGLRVQLGMNSRNSHKPPSTDIFVKKPAIPVAKDKKKGGQKDHKGDTLKMVAMPDSVIIHAPTTCSCCNRTILAQEF